MPRLKPCQSPFHLYLCLEVQAVPSILLFLPGSAFHKSKFYYRLAGKSWAMLLHWKESSDSNFTNPCVCCSYPYLYPKKKLGDKTYKYKPFLEPHIIVSCGRLLQWPVLLQSSGKDQGLRPSGPHRWAHSAGISLSLAFPCLYVFIRAIHHFCCFSITHLHVLKESGNSTVHIMERTNCFSLFLFCFKMFF